VITELNGRQVASPTDLSNAEGLLPVGAELKLKLLREGETIAVNATLRAQVTRSNAGEKLDPRLAGAEVTDLPSRLAQRGVGGVALAKVAANSRAAANGLQTGDIITAVNQRDVADIAAFEAAEGKHPSQLLLTIVRGRGAFFLLLE
jgi:S1-C subfamily serine protease